MPEHRRRGGSFSAFVHGIAVREVGWVLRGRAAPGAVASPAARMAALVEALPEQQREVMVLRVGVGLSAEQVGEAVGLTAGAVRVVQHRALTALRGLTGGGPE